MPHPQNTHTKNCAICILVAKVNDGTIFSTWKTILKIRPNLQGRSRYSTIVLSKCTDFSQPKANWKCAQIFWALLISLCVIFHDTKLEIWQQNCLEKDTHQLLIFCSLCERSGYALWEKGCPWKQSCLLCVSLQKKSYFPKWSKRALFFFSANE